jgi:hypothetical protein
MPVAYAAADVLPVEVPIREPSSFFYLVVPNCPSKKEGEAQR